MGGNYGSNYSSRATGSRMSFGSRNSQMQKLEALFGGKEEVKTPAHRAMSPQGGRQALEEKLSLAFKAAKDAEHKEAAAKADEADKADKADNAPFSAVDADNIKAPSAYRLRLERIKNATDETELNAAISTFVASHELPGDIDIILKVLAHPDETIVRKGLSELVGMVERKEISGTSLITEALAQLEKRGPGPEVRSYIDGLRAMLA